MKQTSPTEKRDFLIIYNLATRKEHSFPREGTPLNIVFFDLQHQQNRLRRWVQILETLHILPSGQGVIANWTFSSKIVFKIEIVMVFTPRSELLHRKHLASQL
ncbi:hypothetical protein RRG08_064601 [Elysia crispata]|uniref:Uncharacterized protein n=1 Tax=Elysia crispata TaxID=231223 RepID=A0AAE1ECL4_9GAST|nr:hypothetical protein RRG08_064601 [Elysia crispata]